MSSSGRVEACVLKRDVFPLGERNQLCGLVEKSADSDTDIKYLSNIQTIQQKPLLVFSLQRDKREKSKGRQTYKHVC